MVCVSESSSSTTEELLDPRIVAFCYGELGKVCVALPYPSRAAPRFRGASKARFISDSESRHCSIHGRSGSSQF
jgi:hypothetical protein